MRTALDGTRTRVPTFLRCNPIHQTDRESRMLGAARMFRGVAQRGCAETADAFQAFGRGQAAPAFPRAGFFGVRNLIFMPASAIVKEKTPVS